MRGPDPRELATARCRRRTSVCWGWCGTWRRSDELVPAGDGPPPRAARLWGKAETRDADFTDLEPTQECVDEAFAALAREVAYAEEWVAAHDDLGVLGDLDGGKIELRTVLVHMIEEYARHCGHADLLRECIDGRTGQ